MIPHRASRTTLGLVAIAAAVLLALLPATLFAQTPPTATATPVAVAATPTPTPAPGITFAGYVPRDGVSLVTMQGAGAPADIVQALAPLGCQAQTLALTNRGAFSVYVAGAPDFVNADFPGYVSTGTALAIRCKGAPTTVRTQVTHFVPARPDASTAQQGSCFAGSVALPARADAFRCSTGNQIHDPCFELADNSVVCGADPATGAKGFLLTLTQPLPAANVPASAAAAAASNGWMVQLDDGAICEINTGATGGVNGERANYGCPNQQWIFGDLMPGTGGAPWTAMLGTMSVGANGYSLGSARQAIVTKVWQ